MTTATVAPEPEVRHEDGVGTLLSQRYLMLAGSVLGAGSVTLAMVLGGRPGPSVGAAVVLVGYALWAVRLPHTRVVQRSTGMHVLGGSLLLLGLITMALAALAVAFVSAALFDLLFR